jgi:hypothetical protein
VARDLGFGLAGEVPNDWSVREVDDVLELLPRSDRGAAHISVYRRDVEGPPEAGEAAWFVEPRPGWETTETATEEPDGAELVAFASYVDSATGRRWDVGTRVGSIRAVVFTYNDDGSVDPIRETARQIFWSIRNIDA